jgi:hypothetical protein
MSVVSAPCRYISCAAIALRGVSFARATTSPANFSSTGFASLLVIAPSSPAAASSLA